MVFESNTYYLLTDLLRFLQSNKMSYSQQYTQCNPHFSTITNKRQGITYGQIEIVFCIFHTFQGNDGKRNHKVKWGFLVDMPAKHKAACVSIGYPSCNHPWLGISPSLYKTWSYCKQDNTECNNGGNLQFINLSKHGQFTSVLTHYLVIGNSFGLLPCF